MATNDLSADNVIKKVYDPGTVSLQILGTGGVLVPDKFDAIALTYVTAGNGLGEVETATYSLQGTDIAILTLTYDANNKLISVARTNP